MSENRLSALELRVDALSRVVGLIEGRLAALEQKSASEWESAPRGEAAPPATVHADVGVGLSLLGRTLLVLGGAYLLRAITEAAVLPQWLGLALGFAYAISWIVVADRAGARSRKTSAAFHGVAAAAVSYPLLWEATVKFQLLTPAQSAVGIAVVTSLAMAVSWRRNLVSLAWAHGGGAIVAAFALALATRSVTPFTTLVVVVGAGLVGLATRRAAFGLEWMGAFAADFMISFMTFGFLIGRSSVRPATAIAVQLVFTTLFLAILYVRVLGDGRAIGRFEAIQGALTILLGYGGALQVAPSYGLLSFGVGAGALSYWLAFSRPVLHERERHFLFFTTAGLLFIWIGTARVFEHAAVLWCVLAVVGTKVGARASLRVMSLQGSLFLLAAAGASGLLVLGVYAFGVPAYVAWPLISRTGLATLGTSAVTVVLAGKGAAPWRLVSLLVLVWGAGAVLLSLLATRLAGPPGAGADPAILAVLRTAVLSVTAVLLGVMSRHDVFREASSLVYPLLIACGIKLVMEDFQKGRTTGLFLSLAFTGGALVLAPRLRRPL